MTTNKPEVVAWIWDYRGRHMATTDYNQALELAEPPYPTEVEPLIRLADYQRLQADHERLQAECEKLRKDAGTERQIQRAAQHLPEGWRITVEVRSEEHTSELQHVRISYAVFCLKKKKKKK